MQDWDRIDHISKIDFDNLSPADLRYINRVMSPKIKAAIVRKLMEKDAAKVEPTIA
jgi:hypothetical protein